jgi:hypothetical protein
MPDELLTAAGVAALLKLHPATVRALPYFRVRRIKIGAATRWSRADVETFIALEREKNEIELQRVRAETFRIRRVG